MVDLSNIGKSLNADPLIAAGAAQSSGVGSLQKKKPVRKANPSRGLGLEDIPDESPYVPVEDASVHEAEAVEEMSAQSSVQEIAPEAAASTLQQIDAELAETQAMLKQLIGEKIKLADKSEDRRHELLISAYADCKNAYQKIKAARDALLA
jgi:hypothetical protein